MSFFFQPFLVVAAQFADYVRQQQELVIEYLQAENQVLREQLGGSRVLLNDDQRRRLAVKGNALGRRQLKKIATITQADTILRWHRELIISPEDFKPSSRIGRPRKSQEVVNLVCRMARENTSWGYKRIEGAMRNLHLSISSSTVANILRQHGIEPAPNRRRTISWSTFFRAHKDAFEGIDWHSIVLWIIFERLNRWFGASSDSEELPIVVEANQETPQENSYSIRINIPQVAEAEVPSARAPPRQTVAFPSMTALDIRRAA